MRSTNGSVLVDTNIWVYRVDRNEPVKMRHVEGLLRGLGDRAVVSTQVLMEYCAVLRAKAQKLGVHGAELETVRRVAEIYPVLPVTAEVVDAAIDGIVRFGFSTWDAQLWATAKVHGVPVVMTEDRQCVGEADGVRFVDPFE